MLSITVPVYNEEQNLPILFLYERIRKTAILCRHTSLADVAPWRLRCKPLTGTP